MLVFLGSILEASPLSPLTATSRVAVLGHNHTDATNGSPSLLNRVYTTITVGRQNR